MGLLFASAISTGMGGSLSTVSTYIYELESLDHAAAYRYAVVSTVLSQALLAWIHAFYAYT